MKAPSVVLKKQTSMMKYNTGVYFSVKLLWICPNGGVFGKVLCLLAVLENAVLNKQIFEKAAQRVKNPNDKKVSPACQSWRRATGQSLAVATSEKRYKLTEFWSTALSC